MSLVPQDDDFFSLVKTVENVSSFAGLLLYHAYHIYYWLQVAPTLVKYKLKQLGRNGIDHLPLLPSQTKAEIKRWMKDHGIL